MPREWLGPTPWDMSIKVGGPFLAGDIGAQMGYRAAMNSPEVKEMYEAIVAFRRLVVGDLAAAVDTVMAAYEAGLVEVP